MFTILKIGGRLINEPDELDRVLDYFCTIDRAILVHGGGRRADQLLKRLQIEPLMRQGRRITDAATLEVVVMVYAGLINSRIVAALQAKGRNAIGLKGADAAVFRVHQRPAAPTDYGFAGDIDSVDGRLLARFLAGGLHPVIAPITADPQGQLLNTNADTMAARTAAAMAELDSSRLLYAFELPGVLEDIQRPDSVIERMSRADYEQLQAAGRISAGMVPKLDNAFAAVTAGVADVRIGDLEALKAGRGTQLIA